MKKIKFLFFLAGLMPVLLPDSPQAREQWASPPPYRGPASRGMLPLDEMRRRAYERDREWRQREEEQRRRDEDERLRLQWRLEDERRREARERLDERARDGERRAFHEERERMERSVRELPRRKEEGSGERNSGRGGPRREPEYRGKGLDAGELRRYGLIRPGERP